MQTKSLVGVNTLLEPQVDTGQKRRQVGILGGNFNPVHTTHLILADQVGHSLGLEKVYLMPEYLPPHVDHKETISPQHRLKMLQLAIENNPLLDIETIELERKGTSYTFDTMTELTARNPDTDYYFIIGGDMVEYLPTWHRVDELMELVNFVGVRRPNYGTQTPYPIIWVDAPLMDLSSTTIRKKIAQGCSVRYLLPDNVLNYIQEEELYRNEI